MRSKLYMVNIGRKTKVTWWHCAKTFVRRWYSPHTCVSSAGISQWTIYPRHSLRTWSLGFLSSNQLSIDAPVLSHHIIQYFWFASRLNGTSEEAKKGTLQTYTNTCCLLFFLVYMLHICLPYWWRMPKSIITIIEQVILLPQQYDWIASLQEFIHSFVKKIHVYASEWCLSNAKPLGDVDHVPKIVTLFNNLLETPISVHTIMIDQCYCWWSDYSDAHCTSPWFHL